MSIAAWLMALGWFDEPAIPQNPRPPAMPPKPVPAIGLREPKIVQMPSPNCHAGGPGRKIELVVLHCTEGSYDGSIRWLRDGDRPNRTSAHYVVAKDGRVAQLVQDQDVAWHAGFGTWRGRGNINTRSIGIEIENKNDGKDPYPAIQLETVMWLTARTCKANGLKSDDVVGHAQVDPERKTDPRLFPWSPFLASLKQHLEVA